MATTNYNNKPYPVHQDQWAWSPREKRSWHHDPVRWRPGPECVGVAPDSSPENKVEETAHSHMHTHIHGYHMGKNSPLPPGRLQNTVLYPFSLCPRGKRAHSHSHSLRTRYRDQRNWLLLLEEAKDDKHQGVLDISSKILLAKRTPSPHTHTKTANHQRWDD